MDVLPSVFGSINTNLSLNLSFFHLELLLCAIKSLTMYKSSIDDVVAVLVEYQEVIFTGAQKNGFVGFHWG
jgi:hypothetical protein